MSYFTSIFHEEVIPMNEFRGEAEAAHAARRLVDKGTHIHRDKKIDRMDHKYRDHGSLAMKDPATNAKEANMRKDFAKENKENFDKFSDKKDDKRAKRKEAQKESFLPNIELI